MLLEPDRFRHTPPIAPERTHAPPRPMANADARRGADAPLTDGRETKPPPEKT